MDKIVLFNPLSGKKRTNIKELIKKKLNNDKVRLFDVTEIGDVNSFCEGIGSDKEIIICGGDGTLNRFVNSIDDDFKNPVYYLPTGNGNDFVRDISPKYKGNVLDLKPYITDLPTTDINGKKYKFLNNIGFGLDGFCCFEAERLRNLGKKANYKMIALKGLLAKYKPVNARVTVDGKINNYKNVYLLPTMNGRFYGGGVMMAPHQKRLSENKKLSVVILHTIGRLMVLPCFPTIYTGLHVKLKRYVDVLTGNDITVEFDRPSPIQIDGELIGTTLTYHAETK